MEVGVDFLFEGGTDDDLWPEGELLPFDLVRSLHESIDWPLLKLESTKVCVCFMTSAYSK